MLLVSKPFLSPRVSYIVLFLRHGSQLHLVGFVGLQKTEFVLQLGILGLLVPQIILLFRQRSLKCALGCLELNRQGLLLVNQPGSVDRNVLGLLDSLDDLRRLRPLHVPHGLPVSDIPFQATDHGI